MSTYSFPRQKVLCDESPFSRELLLSLLEKVYASSPPFTGYFKIISDRFSLYFLFFFNGAPFSAGSFRDGRPISCSIQEFGEYLASSAHEVQSVTLCETDQILLQCMIHFLQEEPEVKAPTALIDLESVTRQIGEAGADAMIALCRDNAINFFFFKDGNGAQAYYSDLEFKRPKGMTIDEEMLLYAFQPGNKVQAFIFRDIVTAMANGTSLLDKDSLYNLLTNGIPKNRRKGDMVRSPMPAGTHGNMRSGDKEISSTSTGNSRYKRSCDTKKLPIPATDGINILINALCEKPILSLVLTVESGPLQGKRFVATLPFIIGRKDCDLILDDQRISRRHAKLEIVDNRLTIEDLASKNGTKVNGETVTKKQLFPNDLISLGPVKLRISPA